MVKVTVAIAYIESCGYYLVRRTRGYYHFRNEARPAEFRDMIFSLKELRETYRNGW